MILRPSTPKFALPGSSGLVPLLYSPPAARHGRFMAQNYWVLSLTVLGWLGMGAKLRYSRPLLGSWRLHRGSLLKSSCAEMLRKDVPEWTNDAELWWSLYLWGWPWIPDSIAGLDASGVVVISLELLNFVPATPKIPQDLRCTFEVFTSMGGHAVNCRTDFTVSLLDWVIGSVGFTSRVRPFFSSLGLGCRQFGQIIRSSHFSHSKAPWLESHLKCEGCQYDWF